MTKGRVGRNQPTMARIQNNPKASEGPRMPLIQPKSAKHNWLKPINGKVDQVGIAADIVVLSLAEQGLARYVQGRSKEDCLSV